MNYFVQKCGKLRCGEVTYWHPHIYRWGLVAVSEDEPKLCRHCCVASGLYTAM